MKKRIILFTILLTFISPIIISPIISAEVTSRININTDAEIETPLKIEEQKEIDIEINYKLNVDFFTNIFYRTRLGRIGRGFLFGRDYIFPLVTRLRYGTRFPSVTLNLSLESPEWCKANFEQWEFQLTMDAGILDGKTKTAKLTFILNESAPALKNESIEITAKTNGLGVLIQAASNSLSIPVIPEYISDLNVSEINESKIPPLKNHSVPINITNNGNGETSVSFEIEKPDGWNVSFDPEELIIPTTETKQMTLTVINPPKDFVNETLTLTIKPKSTEEYEEDPSVLNGSPVTLELTFINDKSEKDGDEDTIIDISLVIVVLLVIIFVIIAFFFIKKRRE
jgi:hypothetical protein